MTSRRGYASDIGALLALWAAHAANTVEAGPTVALTPATQPEIDAALAKPSVFEWTAPDQLPLPLWAGPPSKRGAGRRTPAAGAESATRAARRREKSARRRQRRG